MATALKRFIAAVLGAALIAVVVYATLLPNSVTGPGMPGAPGKGSEASGAKGKRAGGGAGGPPVPVLAVPAAIKDVPVILQGVGTARALQQVLVRPQIDGTIVRLPLREGQELKAGDLIAEIDPATYKAQLDQMLAKRALTETQLDNARRDYDRYMKIPGVIAQKTVDTQLAQVKQLEAQIKADTAAIASAETLLGYTRITAPISGRAGMRMVDEGNLVRGGDAGIVVISQLKPIAVMFTLPQQQLAAVNKALATGAAVPIEALDADGRIVIDTGSLRVVDNQVDQQTGTVKMKAEFPNERQQLWPGQFTTVRVRVDTLPGVVTIPVAAVQRGPNGTFAYTITSDNRAVMKPVTLGLVTDTDAVVTAGLSAAELVVTSGFARLTEGATVAVQAAPDVPPQPAPDAGKRRSRDGDAKGRPGGEGRQKGDGKGEGWSKGEGKRKRDAEAAARGDAMPAAATGVKGEAANIEPGRKDAVQ